MEQKARDGRKRKMWDGGRGRMGEKSRGSQPASHSRAGEENYAG